VLMGHGTEHFANSAYAALTTRSRTWHKNVFVGTVEAIRTLRPSCGAWQTSERPR
jgi:sirohydrochlorin cobaltochelatase